MAISMHLALAALILAQGGASSDRQAIQRAVDKSHGTSSRLSSVLVSGDFAVARGEGLHDGLRLTRNGWRVVCQLGAGAVSANVLKRRCGFSSTVATQLAADEIVNAAAARGEFSAAVTSERIAYQFSSAPARSPEAARLQLLNQLNQQMTLGRISRADAIRKWNELRFSVYFP